MKAILFPFKSKMFALVPSTSIHPLSFLLNFLFSSPPPSLRSFLLIHFSISLPLSLSLLPSLLPLLPSPSTGSHEWDDNLLHFSIRQGLGDMALLLLQPRFIAGKSCYAVQKTGLDNRSPLELARKQGMSRSCGCYGCFGGSCE